MAKTTNTKKRTKDAGRILDRITGAEPELRHRIEEQRLYTKIAEVVLAARERAGLTQDQLAKRAGTNQSVITRLEEADYQCRSPTLLLRIAAALHQRLEVGLIPIRVRE